MALYGLAAVLGTRRHVPALGAEVWRDHTLVDDYTGEHQSGEGPTSGPAPEVGGGAILRLCHANMLRPAGYAHRRGQRDVGIGD